METDECACSMDSERMGKTVQKGVQGAKAGEVVWTKNVSS